MVSLSLHSLTERHFGLLDKKDQRTEKTKTEFDPGTKSEGEEDSMGVKKGLGKTPNHLTLSTTSTLSAGSTGSQAKLIQSSHHPEHYQPSQVKDLGEFCEFHFLLFFMNSGRIPCLETS